MSLDDHNVAQATTLMTAFAERTGLTMAVPPTRYLWTDAFAVCTFLGLARTADEQQEDFSTYRDLARRLVEQVHEILGRHRADDPREGWLSGLGNKAGHKHPTRGGLRIGKPLPERAPGEPYNERLEWDRDGQYFHYLTKWMHALDIMARAMGEADYALWAQELAQTATEAFVYQEPGGHPRMYWKMSVDLSRPLVPSMGHHDPLDGYITLQQLRATAKGLPACENAPSLQNELRTFAQMVQGRDWGTTDPLGLGGLMMDATRLAQLIRRGESDEHQLLVDLLRSAEAGLRRWLWSGSLRQPAARRLAFRELGLAIGLQGVRWMRVESSPGDAVFAPGSRARVHLEALSDHLPLGEQILSFWLARGNQQGRTWTEHEDINAVMLAAALVPEGFLLLPRFA